MPDSLSFNPNSVSKLVAARDWVHAFSAEYERVAKALIVCDYPDVDLFEQRIIVSGRNTYKEHREAIRRWMLLAWHKGRSLFTVLQTLPTSLKLETAARSQFGDVELGPIDSDAAAALDQSQLSRSRDANIIMGYSRDAILNCCGYFISELFFSFEAMSRVVCMGSCLQFFYRTILPNVTVQHKDVFDALSCLSSDSREKVACRMCRASDVCCSAQVFRCLKDFYLRLYHLRVIRDYKTEFYTTEGLAEALLNTLVPLGLEVIFKTELFMSQSIGNRMHFPLSLSQERSHIDRIKFELFSGDNLMRNNEVQTTS